MLLDIGAVWKANGLTNTCRKTLAIHPYKIKYASSSDRELWDGYVLAHQNASLFHMFGWRDVIHGTYGHTTYYLMAIDVANEAARRGMEAPGHDEDCILGVLPLVHFKHKIFGNTLVSLPFVDGGGILASCKEAEEFLLSEVIKLGQKVGARQIELRQEHPLLVSHGISACCIELAGKPLEVAKKSNKVRMLLNLPDSSDTLIKSFKSKLRSQIAKPLKEGLTSRTGGMELLRDFYRVFLANMRDLGSPVHSMKLMHHTLGEFSECSRIIVVYKSTEPVAAALVIGLKSVLRNPWASALRKYASLSPNMLLYLRVLEYACDTGYKIFDFGRSSVGEGTYKFKEQWGALPAPLHWDYISLDGKVPNPESSTKERFEKATRYWKKLPLLVTRVVGPRIRRHISL